MKILWDMRLFSTGYRDRGVGVYCREVALSVLRHRPDVSIFIWADPERLPAGLKSDRVTVIPYRHGTWKSSIFMLPFLALRYRISLIHYWVALGPLSSIGIAPLMPAPAVATIHDLGIELWDTPHGRFLRTTPYWHAQRRFISSVKAVITNSSSTLHDVLNHLNLSARTRAVVPMPMYPAPPPVPVCGRKPYFITLGGGIHKNLSRTVEAFTAARKTHSGYHLIIVGQSDSAEQLPDPLPDGVSREPSMARYEEHLQNCSGLFFCSLYEGLGIPPLEAMRFGCPLLLSAIPSLQETCGGAAPFVDPRSVADIADGITALITDNDTWSRKSAEGFLRYQLRCSTVSEQLCAIYQRVTGKQFGNLSVR
jgi:glycosyltransferase involved in cell wall biosynthesis